MDANGNEEIEEDEEYCFEPEDNFVEEDIEEDDDEENPET